MRSRSGTRGGQVRPVCLLPRRTLQSSIGARRPSPGSRKGRIRGRAAGERQLVGVDVAAYEDAVDPAVEVGVFVDERPGTEPFTFRPPSAGLQVPRRVGEPGRDIVDSHPDRRGDLDALVAGDRQDVADPPGLQPRPQDRVQALNLIAGGERHEDRTAAARPSLGSRDRKRQHRPLAINGA